MKELPFAMLVTGLALIFGGCDKDTTSSGDRNRSHEDSTETTVVAKAPAAMPLPRHEVLNRSVSDTPIKTQVQLDLLVGNKPSTESLRSLLTALFDQVKREKGFQYHSSPTHVYIYAYPDKERAKSGTGGWVAMLSSSGEGERPDVRINESLLKTLAAGATVSFNLTEGKRKEIFSEVVQAEDRANREAEAKFPLGGSNARQQLERQSDYIHKTAKQYKQDIAKKHGLTEKQLTAISVEGLEKHWPMP